MPETSSRTVTRTHQGAGPITFWFDFASPYAWLASIQIEALAARCGRPLAWRAMLLGVAFKQTGMVPMTGQPLRGDYARRDLARLARRLGRTLTEVAQPPGTSVALGRVFHAIALADPGLAARFAKDAFATCFERAEALDTDEAARAFATRLGPEAARAAAEATSPPAREALRSATQEAIAQGVFGAPFFIVDGEPFWGQDRMPLLEAWLREGPW